MKIAILLLGLGVTVGTWWWATNKSRTAGKLTFSQQVKIGLHSLLMGAAVYFGLVFVALIYLMVTT
jgi:hypothetical protein